MEPTYFTCTLGEAASLKLTNHSFLNINQFIESQAKSIPGQPAVGFAKPDSTSPSIWNSSVWTFADIKNGSEAVATLIRQKFAPVLGLSRTVALICPSTPEFLFTWLALMKLGYAVLLIAPQCQPPAIVHLCKACNVTAVFHDDVYSALAGQTIDLAREERLTLNAIALPFSNDQDLPSVLAKAPDRIDNLPNVMPHDVAYLHHTSGTSSGVPKPIPQTHRAGVGVLPAFPDGKHTATFTTTPLYHGGIADLFRAWASGAMIWLFPGKDIPITAANVTKCLESAAWCTQKQGVPPVKYFSSVPYVLQMLEADKKGLRFLQGMDIVGVGGAALPTEVGDRLVTERVNLISRFGSAECGFLMSSHRSYNEDKEWRYLRSYQGSEFLRFEKRDDGLSELVILQGWPHMAKSNREDGSYATADLFMPHESIHDAWSYHSRADSQLTLITGKKFDPAPLESTLSTSELLDDVLIFGNGKPFPGALLFRSKSARALSDDELIQNIWPTLENLNSGSQDHARIPRKMLVPMHVLDQPLEKSSKGTIIRGATEARFATDIENAYTSMSSINAQGYVSDEQVPQALMEMVRSIVPKKSELGLDTNLFSFGVDSVAGMQVRYGLRQLLPQSDKQLPLNVVEDCGTIARLAEYVVKQRHGQDYHDDEDQHELMLRLVDQYSNFKPRTRQPLPNDDDGHTNSHTHDDDNDNDNDKGNDKDVVVLTGATGALGAHMLAQYREMESVSKIFCLVRGADLHASRERVSKALEQRGLPTLSDHHAKVEVLQATIGDENLGLSERDYRRLAAQVTIVVHVAWSVNFRMRLRSFVKDSISSVTNLINLALSSSRSKPARFAYCSSVASVMAYSGVEANIPERIIDDPEASTAMGYSQSKWVAEQICSRAEEQSAMHGRVAVFRVGQLAGDSERGIWNTKEAWPIMLSSVKLTRTLPDLRRETLDWLPVDIAATALTQGIGHMDGNGEGVKVMHVLNENRHPQWGDLLEWLHKRVDFDISSPAQWVSRLEAEQEKLDSADHPAFKLLDHWKKAFSDGQIYTKSGDSGEQSMGSDTKYFDLVKTKECIPCLRDVKPVDENYMLKVWDWVDASM